MPLWIPRISSFSGMPFYSLLNKELNEKLYSTRYTALSLSLSATCLVVLSVPCNYLFSLVAFQLFSFSHYLSLLLLPWRCISIFQIDNDPNIVSGRPPSFFSFDNIMNLLATYCKTVSISCLIGWYTFKVLWLHKNCKVGKVFLQLTYMIS